MIAVPGDTPMSPEDTVVMRPSNEVPAADKTAKFSHRPSEIGT